MSTTTLVILAILTAISSIGALAYVRWREQQRLARARISIDLMDQVNLRFTLADSLKQWISSQCLQYLASNIQTQCLRLNELQAGNNKNIRIARQQSDEWIQNPPNHPPSALPANEKAAEQVRKLIQQLIGVIKEDYQQRRLKGPIASNLLREARLLNVKVCITVFSEKATAAENMHNTSQAQLYYKKVIKTIKAVKQPTEELRQHLAQAEQRLGQLDSQQEKPGSNRLASAAEQLHAEQDDWKKKHF